MNRLLVALREIASRSRSRWWSSLWGAGPTWGATGQQQAGARAVRRHRGQGEPGGEVIRGQRRGQKGRVGKQATCFRFPDSCCHETHALAVVPSLGPLFPTPFPAPPFTHADCPQPSGAMSPWLPPGHSIPPRARIHPHRGLATLRGVPCLPILLSLCLGHGKDPGDRHQGCFPFTHGARHKGGALQTPEPAGPQMRRRLQLSGPWGWPWSCAGCRGCAEGPAGLLWRRSAHRVAFCILLCRCHPRRQDVFTPRMATLGPHRAKRSGGGACSVQSDLLGVRS